MKTLLSCVVATITIGTPSLLFSQTASAAYYNIIDDASWAVWDSNLSNEILRSNRQEFYENFMTSCRVAAGDDWFDLCDDEDEVRMYMNRFQPSSVRCTTLTYKRRFV